MNKQQKTNTFFNTEKSLYHHVSIDYFGTLNIITMLIIIVFLN